MSWGDQIMNELDFWDRERNPMMNKEMGSFIGNFLKEVNYKEEKK